MPRSQIKLAEAIKALGRAAPKLNEPEPAWGRSSPTAEAKVAARACAEVLILAVELGTEPPAPPWSMPHDPEEPPQSRQACRRAP